MRTIFAANNFFSVIVRPNEIFNNFHWVLRLKFSFLFCNVPYQTWNRAWQRPHFCFQYQDPLVDVLFNGAYIFLCAHIVPNIFLPHYYWDDIQKIHSSRTEQCFYFSFNFFCVVRDHFVVLNQWIDVFLCPFSVFYYVSILILLLLHHIYIASFRSILWIVKFIWFFGINFIPIVCVCAVCSHSMCVCAMLYVWYHFAQQKIHRSCKS